MNRFLALSILWSANYAHGAGYYLPNQDAYATARGNAFVATADNPSAIHYNPAGLVQLDRPELSMGVYSIELGKDATIGGQDYGAQNRWQFVPHLYYAHPVNDDLVLGLGLNSPFGLGTEWGDDTPFRTITTDGLLEFITLTVAAGYQINDQLSIGLGLSLNRADLTLDQGITPRPSTDNFRFEGDSLTPSASISALYQPSECHSFGAIFALGTDSTLDGRASTGGTSLGEATFDFMTPNRAAIGYSYRPSPGWNIEANIEWLDWDSLNSLTLDSVLGSNPIPFNWESSFIYEVGISYRTETGYTFSAGYDFNSNAQPDAYYNPAVGDGDRHYINAGVGRDLENWSWNIAYQYGFSSHSVTDAFANLAGESANGKYRDQNHAFVVAAGFQF